MSAVEEIGGVSSNKGGVINTDTSFFCLWKMYLPRVAARWYETIAFNHHS